MENSKKQRIALISVYDKTDIVLFAKELVDLGWKIVSSGGTAKSLQEGGIPVTLVEEITGMGAILSHRVATLHPKIHGGLLALNTDEHLKEMEKYEIPWIDMVCTDFYPLEDEIKKIDATKESVIEKTDIGGPTMVRSGAKGNRITICDAKDRMKVISWLKEGEPDREIFLNNLRSKAEILISRYCALSAGFHSAGFYKSLTLERHQECAYGENAWQKPAFLNKRIGNKDPLSIHNFLHIAGNPPSFNNLCDIDRMLQTVTHIAAGFDKNFKERPFIAIGVKHGNPCGASFSKDKKDVISKMLLGDLRAIFGGSIMLNFEVDEKIAEELIHLHSDEGVRRLLDVVVASGFTEEAIEILSRKKGKCRLLVNKNLENIGIDSLDNAKRYRYVRGGFLEQPNYTFVPEIKNTDAILAWAIGSTSNSNTITIVKDGRLYGNGVGQQDRVGAAKLAFMRADDAYQSEFKKEGKADLSSALAYSDSFFPFPDGPQVLINRGIKTIFATSGSVNDQKIIELCKEQGVDLILIPDQEGRGFYQH